MGSIYTNYIHSLACQTVVKLLHDLQGYWENKILLLSSK